MAAVTNSSDLGSPRKGFVIASSSSAGFFLGLGEPRDKHPLDGAIRLFIHQPAALPGVESSFETRKLEGKISLATPYSLKSKLNKDRFECKVPMKVPVSSLQGSAC